MVCTGLGLVCVVCGSVVCMREDECLCAQDRRLQDELICAQELPSSKAFQSIARSFSSILGQHKILKVLSQ